MYSFTENAKKDMALILDYTFINFGVKAMINYHKSLENCFESLDSNPNLGMKVEYIHKSYYCFYHRSHSVFYQLSDKGINIIRVLHQSMDVSKHFD